jgi:hypothetical protein
LIEEWQRFIQPIDKSLTGGEKAAFSFNHLDVINRGFMGAVYFFGFSG